MKKTSLFPKIINVTDLRYRWPKVIKELEKNKWPVLVVEHSTPKAVIFSLKEAEEIWGVGSMASAQEDPLIAWRKKYAHQFSGWDATKAIRKMRDSRWNSS